MQRKKPLDTYDLKGSYVNRTTVQNGRQGAKGTMKDNDLAGISRAACHEGACGGVARCCGLLMRYFCVVCAELIYLSPTERTHMLEQLKRDSEFLCAHPQHNL
jgi:hypothetical protein